MEQIHAAADDVSIEEAAQTNGGGGRVAPCLHNAVDFGVGERGGQNCMVVGVEDKTAEMTMICHMESVSCVKCESNTPPLVVTAVQAYDIDIHALRNFGLSYDAMRLKHRWDTHHMIPDKMHIALASNIHADVDWKLVVFWVACLEFYQAQTKADGIERDEVQLRNLEKEKKRAAEHNLCVQEAKKAKKAVNNYIVEEKVAVYAKQKSDKAVVTAAAALTEIRDKLKHQKKKLVQSELTYLDANTEKRKSAVEDVLRRQKDRLCHYHVLEHQIVNTNVEVVAAAARVAKTLAEILARPSSTTDDGSHAEASDTLPESVGKFQLCPDTLSITLQYYRHRIRGENPMRRSPTLEELDDQWSLVVNFISGGTKTAMMTIGCAIWRACFYRLFSYEAEKTLFEETHFGLINEAKCVVMTSIDPLQVLNMNTVTSSSSAIFWGLPKPGSEALIVHGLLDFYALNIAPQKFGPRWRNDRDKRQHDRVYLRSCLLAEHKKKKEFACEQQESEPISEAYKHNRIRGAVDSGLYRVGYVKDNTTLKFLGATSFEMVEAHIQTKIDRYNAEHIGERQMSFANIELDHIKPVRQFVLEMSHYKNLQPLFKDVNNSKSAHWSKDDENFWRSNIEHAPNFTAIYTPSVLDSSGQKTQLADTKPR